MRVEICDYCGGEASCTNKASVYLQVAGVVVLNHEPSMRQTGRPQACAACVRRLSDAVRSAAAGVCASFQPIDVKVSVGIQAAQ